MKGSRDPRLVIEGIETADSWAAASLAGLLHLLDILFPIRQPEMVSNLNSFSNEFSSRFRTCHKFSLTILGTAPGRNISAVR